MADGIEDWVETYIRASSTKGREAGLRAVIEKHVRPMVAVPEVWTVEERDGIAGAFSAANQEHGHYESLFAAVAWFLRHRAAALDAMLKE